MKRFQAMAQRITAFVLSAGMMASAAAPTVLAAQQAPSAPLGAENSVDELGNVDVSDETYHEPDDRGLAADAADHTWGEWLEGEYEDGSTVRFRICEDGDAVQFEDGNIMIPEGGSADRTLDDFVTSDQPEWLEQGMLMVSKLPLIVQRSIKNGTMRRIIPNGRSTEARPITMVMMAWVMTMANMDLMCGQVKARTRNEL